MSRLLIVANTDWFLANFRLSLAQAARQAGWDVALASPDGPYVSVLRAHGFVWREIAFSRRGMDPLQEGTLISRLRRLYREERPNLVHHHTIKPVLYGTLAGELSGVETIVNSITGMGHLFISRGPAETLLRPLVLAAYRLLLADRRVHMVFENRGDREYFISRRLVTENRTTLIEGVGVDLEQYQASEEPPGPPMVILPARILANKGVREFVEAARRLRQADRSARFVLVGAPDPGNPSSIDVRTIEGWVAEGWIEWWGKRSDMPAVYRSSHLVILPSYTEGVPTVLLEAAASARAVVASDIPGCREVVLPGKTGILVAVGDAGALMEAIRSLLQDPDRRAQMGRAGREFMMTRFDQRSINQRTLELYENLKQRRDLPNPREGSS